jgi:hypothetical protein
MDQPYSRIADSLMDYQFWSPNDPQKTPYDDTGWTFPELYNVQAVRVADLKVLDAPMEKLTGAVRAKGALTSTGSVYLVNHNADVALVTLRYKFKMRRSKRPEEAFERRRKESQPRLVHRQETSADATWRRRPPISASRLTALASAPSVKTHPVAQPRVALLHTWLSTQTEGWCGRRSTTRRCRYTYISTQQLAQDDNLNAKFDVIVFPAGRSAGLRRSSTACRCGATPLPWKKTEDTPNLGSKIRPTTCARASADRRRPPAGRSCARAAVSHGDGHR